MSYRLPSYNNKACCNSDCNHGLDIQEPCWGAVEVRGEERWGDDDWDWVHACEGHANCLEDCVYQKSDRPEDVGAAPIDDGE
jgi:hypothetical protein